MQNSDRFGPLHLLGAIGAYLERAGSPLGRGAVSGNNSGALIDTSLFDNHLAYALRENCAGPLPMLLHHLRPAAQPSFFPRACQPEKVVARTVEARFSAPPGVLGDSG